MRGRRLHFGRAGLLGSQSCTAVRMTWLRSESAFVRKYGLPMSEARVGRAARQAQGSKAVCTSAVECSSVGVPVSISQRSASGAVMKPM